MRWGLFMDLMTTLSAHLQNGDNQTVCALTRDALARGFGPSDILDRALLPGMAAVGARFRERQIYLPDVLLAARAMHGAMALLKPLLTAGNRPSAGKVVLGTVSGDIHDIGKNLVGFLLQGGGFDVIDLGTDVDAAQFVDAAVSEGASVIGMSALLTTTMIAMQDVVRTIEDRGLSGRIRTIVGGAPVSAEFAREIGADAYAPDAPSAVEAVRALIPNPSSLIRNL